MNNAFSRIGQTCARLGLIGGLMAGGMFAASHEVTVNVPHAITVGSTTLPSGEYTISNLNMPNGDEYFLVRDVNGHAATLQAQRIDSDDQSKSQVVFSKDGDTWHFDKMFVQGDDAGYQFINIK